MRDNVDYRLLERFRAKRQLNAPPEARAHGKRAAAAAERRRLPAIDLRD